MIKNTRLTNIYIKIHNHRNLTFDELVYLSKYDPDCFMKTCDNIIYNEPKAKKILQPEEVSEAVSEPEVKEDVEEVKMEQINQVLDHLKSVIIEDIPIEGISPETVKELLGELYMERIFPHSDKINYLDITSEKPECKFNKTV